MDKNIVAEDVAQLLKNIANPIRLLILCNLLEGTKNVSELLENIDISQSALSQHLILLKENNIIKDNKVGKFVYYHIVDKKTEEILGFLNKICCESNIN